MSRRSFAALLFTSAVLIAPTSVLASQEHLDDANITIASNRDFNAAHGVVSGRGTKKAPYVIRGKSLNSLTISNTSKAVRIERNTITFLTLNYAGGMVDVIRNEVGDLRVNENVERTGMPTSGVISGNRIGSVSQIRHFDGRFAWNTVGYQNEGVWSDMPFFQNLAVNFDGFNGALFDHNTLYGALDARLHGHHHSSAFGVPSHMHAGAVHGEHGDMVDHTVRYHTLRITDNVIYSKSFYALSYIDTNHAGNDRTASSETNPALNKAHLHRTKVTIANNRLIGSGLLVEVFNAEDEIHKGAPQGWLTITGNRITLERSPFPFSSPASGIDVREARYLTLHIASNTISGPAPDQPSPLREWMSDGEGILLDRIDHARVMIASNTVSNRQSGVRATQMTSSVWWTVRGLRTSGVDQPVSYDSSVANEPRR